MRARHSRSCVTTSTHAPTVVWEAIVTGPRNPKCVIKCTSWVEPGGFTTKLIFAHPGRHIMCAFFFPEALLEDKKLAAYLMLEKKAASATSVLPVKVAIEGLRN